MPLGPRGGSRAHRPAICGEPLPVAPSLFPSRFTRQWVSPLTTTPTPSVTNKDQATGYKGIVPPSYSNHLLQIVFDTTHFHYLFRPVLPPNSMTSCRENGIEKKKERKKETWDSVSMGERKAKPVYGMAIRKMSLNYALGLLMYSCKLVL